MRPAQDGAGIEQYDVTHTKFTCHQCGDQYIFLELGDWPKYCPTCGADQDKYQNET